MTSLMLETENGPDGALPVVTMRGGTMAIIFLPITWIGWFHGKQVWWLSAAITSGNRDNYSSLHQSGLGMISDLLEEVGDFSPALD